MTTFSFADSYRAAGLAPGGDVILQREGPFEQLRSEINSTQVIALTRLYYGLPGLTDNERDWFRDAFRKTDASFSMIDNDRESAVLASCLLAAAMCDERVAAGLALLTASAARNRTPLVDPNRLEEARDTLMTMAAKSRRNFSPNTSIIKQLAANKTISAAATKMSPSGDLEAAAELIKKVSEDSRVSVNTLSTQVVAVISPLIQQIAELQEEIGVLWWYVGGWSRVLDQPFDELDLPVAATLAGVDLAALVSTPPGPLAAPALFQRLILADRESKSLMVTIQEVVDVFPLEVFGQLGTDDRLEAVPDICPVLTALRKAADIGAGTGWHDAFCKESRLSVDAAFHPLELAMQTYREAMLVSLLD